MLRFTLGLTRKDKVRNKSKRSSRNETVWRKGKGMEAQVVRAYERKPMLGRECWGYNHRGEGREDDQRGGLWTQ